MGRQHEACVGELRAPNGIPDIRLQGIDQADETNNDKLRIQSVDKLFKAFLTGVDVFGEEVARYHTPCEYQHATTQCGPLLLDRDDALTRGMGEVQGPVTPRREDVGAAREENVRGTLNTKQKIGGGERIP